MDSPAIPFGTSPVPSPGCKESNLILRFWRPFGEPLPHPNGIQLERPLSGSPGGAALRVLTAYSCGCPSVQPSAGWEQAAYSCRLPWMELPFDVML